MRRILLILAIFVALLPQRHTAKDDPVKAGPLLVTAEPLLLNDSDPSQKSVGPLRWLGSWAIHSKQTDFGSISAMLVQQDGSILGLSDSGTLMGFHVDAAGRTDGGRPFIAPLPIQPEERDWPSWRWDSESMVHDPATDRYWVGFELQNRICRYSPGFARVESCVFWPEMAWWPKTGGPEAMARLADGRFLVFSEKAEGQDGGKDLLLFQGDPADPDTPHPVRMTYRPPQGYVPTDALPLGGNRLLVLNRRVTMYEGFTGSIAMVEMPELKAGALLVGKQIARLAPPLVADNYEALALSWEHGQPVLSVMSDDNYEFFQRTLLVKFALPPEWVR
ncbi:MAG TPA: esterase-like activity of phytase family protein [Sphingobium sp.]